MKNILFLFIISLLFTSCGALTEPKIDFTKPPQQVTKEPPVVRKNKGSFAGYDRPLPQSPVATDPLANLSLEQLKALEKQLSGQKR